MIFENRKQGYQNRLSFGQSESDALGEHSDLSSQAGSLGSQVDVKIPEKILLTGDSR